MVVANDKLLEIVPEGMPLQDGFGIADEILRQVWNSISPRSRPDLAQISPRSRPHLAESASQGIMGISDIVVKPGLINVDFADVRSLSSRARPSPHPHATTLLGTRADSCVAGALGDDGRGPRADGHRLGPELLDGRGGLVDPGPLDPFSII